VEAGVELHAAADHGLALLARRPLSVAFDVILGSWGSMSINADGQWQLAGNAAELYESVLVPTQFQPWAADLIELADLRHGERVLDVACGTGVVARLAAQHVGTTGEVTGLDLNAGMLLVARSLPVPPGAPVAWVEGSALAMPLADASFDVVLCQQGFQFFSDPRAGLQEMKRVLVSGGRVLLSLWEGPTPYTVAMSAAVERHAGPEAATTLRRSRHCPDPESVRHFLEDAGFRNAQTRARTLTRRLPGVADFVLRHLAATPVAGAVAALSEGARAALAGEVSMALRPYEDGDGIVFPEVVNVVTAVR
jgi:ubiquinone/menaquinone biosynthesis C-methylase UbiE